MKNFLHKIISLHSPNSGARIGKSVLPLGTHVLAAMINNLNNLKPCIQNSPHTPQRYKKDEQYGFFSKNTEDGGIFFPSNTKNKIILNVLRHEPGLANLKQGDWIQVTTKDRSFKAVKQADGTFCVLPELPKEVSARLATISKELEGNEKEKSGKVSDASIDYLLKILSAYPHSKSQIKAIVEKINHRTYKTGLTANLKALFEALDMPLPKTTATIDGKTYNLGKKIDMGDGKMLYYITSGGKDEHESRLGRGGFGYVRLAVLVTKEGDEKLVAVKKIESDKIDADIENEIKMLQLLKGKGFTSAPEFHGYFTDTEAVKHDGEFYDEKYLSLEIGKGSKKCIVMDYIPGKDLQEILAAGDVSMTKKIVLLSKLFDLLESFHATDVVHQDLKLENIKRNDREELILLDFSNSYEADKAQFNKGGTLEYLAPELTSKPPKASSKKSDVYAMSVLMMGLVLDGLPVNPSHEANIMLLKEIRKTKLEITTPNEEFGFLDNKTTSEDKFYNLLSQMMDANPDKRPSAFHAKRDWLEILAGQELSE